VSESTDFLSETKPQGRLELLSTELLIDRVEFLEQEVTRLISDNYRLRNQDVSDTQIRLLLEEQLRAANAARFAVSSERYKQHEEEAKNTPDSIKPAKPRIKRPSERYPNVPVREQVVAMDPVPTCDACGSQMSDSGMRESAEQLTVIPKKYEILKVSRVKYRCSCHSCIATATAPRRIIEGSSYSDEMTLDVAMSKYCDLIPIHRYVAMAARSGVSGIPSQSLIELTHGLSDFVEPAYELLKAQMMSSRVLHADETPHRMLEGSSKSSWYLWGFSTPRVCFLECHDTRSGDVASEILRQSKCEVIVSDVYAGYGKAIRVSNAARLGAGLASIANANCNAHARRYFFKSVSEDDKTAEWYLDRYHQIYELNKQSKGQAPPGVLEFRVQMRPIFEAMQERATSELSGHSTKSQYGKALRYFVDNYEGLTLFLADAEVPIDNNPQERLLRNHVIGRKTWYGTHSKRGAKTAGVLFSLVETCKMNEVNPREYFNALVTEMLKGLAPFTPAEFKLR